MESSLPSAARDPGSSRVQCQPLERWSLDDRVANCRGTRLHAPVARPTGATPSVSSKHVIVTVIFPACVHACVRATTVTTRHDTTRVSAGGQWTRAGRGWLGERGTREALDLCLLILKISRFPHTLLPPSPLSNRRRRLIDCREIAYVTTRVSHD